MCQNVAQTGSKIWVDGKEVTGTPEGDHILAGTFGSGVHRIERMVNQ